MAVTGKTASIKDALIKHLATMSPAVPYAKPSIAYDASGGATYLEPRFLPNRTDKAGVGLAAPRRFRGLFQVNVRVKLPNGSTSDGVETEAENMADRVCEHFAPAGNGVTIAENGVRVRVGSFDGSPGVPSQLPSLHDSGWHVVPVTVPWYCDA